MKYRRITLKLSGEAFSTPDGGVIEASFVQRLAVQIGKLVSMGVAVSIVPGGGNVFRGRDLTQEAQSIGISSVTADQIGMLATVMNALVLRDALASIDVGSEVFTPHAINGVSRGFVRQEATAVLEQGSVALCAGGTGNPLFTTDTAAALRAVELSSDVVLKASVVDGIYEEDPRGKDKVRKFESLTFEEVIQRDLRVMDLAAFALCRDNRIPIIVYDLNAPQALTMIAKGANVGTLVHSSEGS